MSDEIRVNRANDSLTSNMPPMRGGNGRGQNNLPWIILGVIILLVILGGVMFRDRLFPSRDNSGSDKMAAEDKLSGYQAVFLSNTQVYFGKLSDVSATYATLKDIYYLQVTQPPLQGSQQQGSQAQTQTQAQPQISLVKLGNELHGPVDEMKINRDQILFFEDLKEDGRVMQAIREYQKNPPSSDNSQQQQQPATQQTPATTPVTTPKQ